MPCTSYIDVKLLSILIRLFVCFLFFSKYSFPTATRSTWCKKFPKELPSLPVAIIKHLPILCPSEGNVDSQALKKQHLAILINSKGNETRKPCDEPVIAIHCKKINIDSQNIELSSLFLPFLSNSHIAHYCALINEIRNTS